jgi:hypothetical protein
MKKNILNTGLMGGMMALGLVGCDMIDKIADALEGGPQTSYCESLCDWATDCASGESSLSEDEMMSRCSEATHELDSICKDAEKGNLGPDEILANNECVGDVDTMSCAGLTGGEVEVMAGTPPLATCGGAYGLLASDPEGVYHTYNAARNAVLVTGSELCQEITESLCDSLIGCVPGSEDTPEARELAMEQCMDTMNGFNSSCKSEGLYDQDLPIDYNIPRGFAKSCVEALDASDSLCEPGDWGDVLECAGAFWDPLSSTNLLSSVIDGAKAVVP